VPTFPPDEIERLIRERQAQPGAKLEDLQEVLMLRAFAEEDLAEQIRYDRIALRIVVNESARQRRTRKA